MNGCDACWRGGELFILVQNTDCVPFRVLEWRVALVGDKGLFPLIFQICLPDGAGKSGVGQKFGDSIDISSVM